MCLTADDFFFSLFMSRVAERRVGSFTSQHPCLPTPPATSSMDTSCHGACANPSRVSADAGDPSILSKRMGFTARRNI